MTTRISRAALRPQSGNLSGAERWLSLLGGVGLALTAARGKGTFSRVVLGAAGVSLLARGASGYCAIKSTLAGETSLQEGLKEQWSRLQATVQQAVGQTSGELDSMESMYTVELQELHSAEEQLSALAEKLSSEITNGALAFRISEYSTELGSRIVDLESLLASTGAQVRSHPDDAMQALIKESNKMARVCAPSVRDAALAASLQRIIHYKIAGYGAIASYAKALGRHEEAGFFAELADRDKAIDAEISELAKSTLNPDAARAPRESITVAPLDEGSPQVRH